MESTDQFGKRVKAEFTREQFREFRTGLERARELLDAELSLSSTLEVMGLASDMGRALMHTIDDNKSLERVKSRSTMEIRAAIDLNAPPLERGR